MAMQREGQLWVQDTLVDIAGIDVLFRDQAPSWLEYGYKWADIKRTMGRVRSMAMIGKQWAKTGQQMEDLAKDAEAKGHIETARGLYMRATLYFGRARWAITRDGSPQKVAWNNSCLANYKKVMEFSNFHIEKVELPYENGSIPALLYLPPNVAKPPCVLYIPGMDSTKEEMHMVQENVYLRRGMAVLCIDCPGQGEARMRGFVAKIDSFEKAGRTAIDYLKTRSEIDHDKIGSFGLSMGSYWSMRVAAFNREIKAAAGVMGNFGPKYILFNIAQPQFKRAFMNMAGISDEAVFDKQAEQMTLRGQEHLIKCPVLMATGEFDQVSSLDESMEFYNALQCPKEFWIFEDQFHALGDHRAHVYEWIADWLKDKLQGRYDPKMAKVVQIPNL